MLVQDIQERAARALPAEQVRRLGSWWLRSAPGCAWWVRSVLPHGEQPDLGAAIETAERFCADAGTVPRFQITPGACPPGLDAVLAERGYRQESPMSVQTAETSEVVARTPRGGHPVRVEAGPSPEWFAVWHAVHGGAADAERRLLHRVAQESGYAAARLDGRIVAVGRAVADTGWAGVFGMATLPHARGNGAAGGVLAALAEWARGRAERMYLQVDPGNAAPLRRYARAGFGELAAYHYRTRG